MNTGCFLPEGWLLGTAENAVRIRTMGAVKETIAAGDIVEGRATVCDSGHNLYVEFGPWRGFIPREEGAIGISDGTVKAIAILSRVGKPCLLYTSHKHLPPVFGRKKRGSTFQASPVGSSSFLRQDTKIPPVVSFGRYFV